MRIYLDHNATTAIKPAVLEAVTGALSVTGNASSVHAHGRAVHSALEFARAEIARLVGAPDTKGVIFTSGATEANNMVIKKFPPERILTSAIEHPSVMESSPMARRLPVTADGEIDINELAPLLEGVALVSVMLVNNETGVIQPVADIAQRAHAKGALVHVDAVQAAGRIPIDMAALGADYLTLSAHKMGGAPGVGAVIAAPKAPPVKLLYGGGQERRQRAGTENAPAIVGFGVAAKLAAGDMKAYQKLQSLRDRMEKSLQQSIEGLHIYGSGARRVANTSCFSLKGVPADTQLMALDLAGISVSSGSACSSGSVKPSHVLEAMHVAPEIANCALRVSLGWNTTEAEIDQFIEMYVTLASGWERHA